MRSLIENIPDLHYTSPPRVISQSLLSFLNVFWKRVFNGFLYHLSSSQTTLDSTQANSHLNLGGEIKYHPI
jgi:hypothetical protein